MFCNRTYAVLWWEKCKKVYCDSYMIVRTHSPIVLIFVLRLVLRILRTYITKISYGPGFTYLNFCFILQENKLIAFDAS